MAPAGLPSFRPCRAGSSQTRGCAPQTCEALYPPVTASTRHDRGGCFNNPHQVSSGQGGRFGKPSGRITSPQPDPNISPADHTFSPGGFAFSRSAPPSSATPGGAFRRSCLSPQGEFCAGRTGRAAQGSRPKADLGSAGRLLCLLSWRRKKVSRPPGRVPANGGWGKGKPH